MLQITAGVSCSLKLTTEGSVFIGSWFHCGIVYGKNECLYVSLEVCICLYVRERYFLVLVSETINMSDGTAIRWNDTLYIITNLVLNATFNNSICWIGKHVYFRNYINYEWFYILIWGNFIVKIWNLLILTGNYIS